MNWNKRKISFITFCVIRYGKKQRFCSMQMRSAQSLPPENVQWCLEYKADKSISDSLRKWHAVGK